MKHAECMVGQVVSFTYKGTTWVGKITKVNPKNVKVLAYTPSTRMWNVHPSYLRLDDGTAPAPPISTVDVEKFVLGAVVKVPQISSGLFVIVKKRAGSFDVAPLGGDRGLYWSGMAPEVMEPVNFELAGV